MATTKLVDSIRNAIDISEAINSKRIQKIKDEMNKVNEEGELIHSASEVKAFQMAIDIFEGKEGE